MLVGLKTQIKTTYDNDYIFYDLVAKWVDLESKVFSQESKKLGNFNKYANNDSLCIKYFGSLLDTNLFEIIKVINKAYQRH